MTDLDDMRRRYDGPIPAWVKDTEAKRDAAQKAADSLVARMKREGTYGKKGKQ